MPNRQSYQPEVLLATLGVKQPKDIDIEVIAQYCGATVVYEPLAACEARVLGLGDRAIITVNINSIEERRRFSAAHELAHWVYDRGKLAAACTAATIRNSWSSGSEAAANEYASELLLPKSMFVPRVKGRDITFDTVDVLREEFNTSMTATAIRLVRHGPFPSMLICSSSRGREWFVASSEVERRLWPRKDVGENTAAYDLLNGTTAPDRPQDVDADEWIDRENADEYVVREHSRKINDGRVLSLLWWKDQSQVSALH
jgi:Zn-dependent peptidase ImmA (M78 family)